MKYLIVGLGNPGLEYRDTRHNVGFMVLDELANCSNAQFVTQRHAEVTEVKFAGKKLLLVKPNTYMNLSGKALKYWMDVEKIPIENVLVITDDLSLPVGKIRIRTKGTDGGHNGLKDIQMRIGTTEYPRLRFGIGSEFQRGKQADYVLSAFNKDEVPIVEIKVSDCTEIIKSFATIGLERTMNIYNK